MVTLPELRTHPKRDDGARWEASASRADALAGQLQALAARLRYGGEASKMKDALASEVSRIVWAVRGVRVDKAVRISFVLAIESAIKHLDASRAIMASPDKSKTIPASILVSERTYLATATYGSEGLWWFAAEWPEHARRLSVEDCDLAARAVRGETGAKWATLATIITTRLGIVTEGDTLQKYCRKYRAKIGR